MRVRVLGVILFWVLAHSQDVSALAFVPSALEWHAWPEYCRARYVVSGAGQNSKYATRVSPGEVQKWRHRLGKGAWYGLHHYCAALAYLNEAKRMGRGHDRNILYKKTVGETTYAFNRTPAQSPMYAKMAVTIAEAKAALGQFEDAFLFLQKATSAHPDQPAAYAVGALIYRDHGELEKAKEVLLEGNEAVEGKSAELHYILGSVLFDLKEFGAAQEHAARAYELGYPLPGLKRKLEQAGHWTD